VDINKLTRRWWFFVVILLLQLLPPYAAKGISSVPQFLATHLANAPMHQLGDWQILFKVTPILFILGIVFFGNHFSRLFAVYAGVAYLTFNVLQNFSFSPEYGVGILSQNLVTMLLVSLLWFWEAAVGKNDFSPVKLTPLKWGVIALAFWAFWDPINTVTRMPDFNPLYLINNPGGVAFCMMTPVFLAVLITFYPKVNHALLRVNSLAAVIIGIFNVLVVFANPAVYWWFGLLHLPLFILGVYGLVISLRADRT
jgi:hypothetical protein